MDQARISLVLEGASGRRLAVTLAGIGAKVGETPEDEKHDERPYAPLWVIAEPGRTLPAAVGGVRGRQSHNSIQTLAEVTVPAAALGALQLKQGDTLRIGVSIRLRGDVKETFWPVSLSTTTFDSGALASVKLQ
jgi:hypothetical protein